MVHSMDIITRLKLHSKRASDAGKKRAEHIARADEHAQAAIEICKQADLKSKKNPLSTTDLGVFGEKWAAYEETQK
jgi:hypothetical protein